VLVLVLVIATIWVERDRHEAVAGYGVLDASGVATMPVDAGVAVGQPAPVFRLQATTGDIVTLNDLVGQPVVLQFWTSWCLDCVDAIPIFQQVASTHADRVTVLGIAPEETASRTNGALDRAGATYATLLDIDGAVSARYGATPLPFTVVIDGAGQIVAVHEGRVSVAQLESDLASLLP
jgi:peroxiredoxin